MVLVLVAEKPQIPENFEEQTWLKLAEAVGAIQRSCAIRYSLEELYQAVENMCSYKMAAGLYQQLQSACMKHVRANLQQFLGYPFCRVMFWLPALLPVTELGRS